MTKTTIVVADDHRVLHEGLRALIEAEPDLVVVGETNDGPETLRLTERLLPDVLLLDLAMPGLNGLEVTRQIKKRFPNMFVIILSMYADEAYVLEALRNGASGYILKQASATDVIKGIRDVISGGRFLSLSLSQERIDAYLEKIETGPLYPYETLTAREREILQMTAEAKTSSEVGRSLFISPRTVEIHRRNRMRKLGLRNQGELIRYVLKRGPFAG